MAASAATATAVADGNSVPPPPPAMPTEDLPRWQQQTGKEEQGQQCSAATAAIMHPVTMPPVPLLGKYVGLYILRTTWSFVCRLRAAFVLTT